MLKNVTRRFFFQTLGNLSNKDGKGNATAMATPQNISFNEQKIEQKICKCVIHFGTFLTVFEKPQCELSKFKVF